MSNILCWDGHCMSFTWSQSVPVWLWTKKYSEDERFISVMLKHGFRPASGASLAMSLSLHSICENTFINTDNRSHLFSRGAIITSYLIRLFWVFGGPPWALNVYEVLRGPRGVRLPRTDPHGTQMVPTDGTLFNYCVLWRAYSSPVPNHRIHTPVCVCVKYPHCCGPHTHAIRISILSWASVCGGHFLAQHSCAGLKRKRAAAADWFCRFDVMINHGPCYEAAVRSVTPTCVSGELDAVTPGFWGHTPHRRAC